MGELQQPVVIRAGPALQSVPRVRLQLDRVSNREGPSCRASACSWRTMSWPPFQRELRSEKHDRYVPPVGHSF